MVNFCIFIMMVEVVLGVLSIRARVCLLVSVRIDGEKGTNADSKGYAYRCESGYDHCNRTLAPKRKKDIHVLMNVFPMPYRFSMVFGVYSSCFSGDTTYKRQSK